VDEQPFAKTGRFYFAPEHRRRSPEDSEPNRPGYQGSLRVSFEVNGQEQSLLLRSRRTLVARRGRVTGRRTRHFERNAGAAAAELSRFRDSNGAPLVVDGIIGPKTESAIKLFQKAITLIDPNASALAINAVLNRAKVGWLNAGNAPRLKQPRSLDALQRADLDFVEQSNRPAFVR